MKQMNMINELTKIKQETVVLCFRAIFLKCWARHVISSQENNVRITKNMDCDPPMVSMPDIGATIATKNENQNTGRNIEASKVNRVVYFNEVIFS